MVASKARGINIRLGQRGPGRRGQLIHRCFVCGFMDDDAGA